MRMIGDCAHSHDTDASQHAHARTLRNSHTPYTHACSLFSTVYFSPEILRKPPPQLWVRLHGQHILGSPFEVPIQMSAISQDYSRRVALAKEAGRSPDLGGEDGCGGDFVFVTGAGEGCEMGGKGGKGCRR